MSANDKLIKNLENQLDRLVEQLRDLEECKEDISQDEFDSMKDETVEQIKEFTETLDRMNKGDVTLDNKLSKMKMSIQKAIAGSFNTIEMIKMFGEQNATELEQQLIQIDEEYRLKRISKEQMELKKVDVLRKLKAQGHSLSVQDHEFLDKTEQQYLQHLEQITDD